MARSLGYQKRCVQPDQLISLTELESRSIVASGRGSGVVG